MLVHVPSYEHQFGFFCGKFLEIKPAENKVHEGASFFSNDKTFRSYDICRQSVQQLFQLFPVHPSASVNKMADPRLFYVMLVVALLSCFFYIEVENQIVLDIAVRCSNYLS